MSVVCAELRLFGGLEVKSPDATPVALPGKKERELLAAIAIDQGKPVSRERLACDLWDGDDFSARRSLNTALWRLRKSLRAGGIDCENWFDTGSDYIRLRHRTGPEVDVVRMREDIARFRKGQIDPETVAQQLSTLSGGLLPGMSATWLDDCRRVVEQTIVDASVEAADALISREPNWAIELSHAAIRVDPYEERAWRAQIAAYLNSGRRAQAHAAYSKLTSVLSEELGIAPSAQTRALLEPEKPQTITTRVEGSSFARRIDTLTDALSIVLQELSEIRAELQEI